MRRHARPARRGVVSVEYIILMAFMVVAMMVGWFYFKANADMTTMAWSDMRMATAIRWQNSARNTYEIIPTSALDTNEPGPR